MKTPEAIGREVANEIVPLSGGLQVARAASIIAAAIESRDEEWQQEVELFRNENARLSGRRVPIIRQSPADDSHETSGKWYVADDVTDLHYLHADGTWRFGCVDCWHESKADAEKSVELLRRRQRANDKSYRIKPLEWSKAGTKQPWYVAATWFHGYPIRWRVIPRRDGRWCIDGDEHYHSDDFATLEAAKSAVQAEYEAILKCHLEPVT